MSKYLAVSSGGFIGAALRYWLSTLIITRPGEFPGVTLFINISGSFALGLFLTLAVEYFTAWPVEWRLFFGTGLLGSYTTFSAFSVEVLTLFRNGFAGTGLLYSAASLAGGMLMVYSGYRAARFIAPDGLEANPVYPAELVANETRVEKEIL